MIKNKAIRECIGNRFGRLVVNDFSHYGSSYIPYVLCMCDCGKTTIKNFYGIRRGGIQSCGCLQNENRWRHGLSRTREYGIYQSMIQRCYRPTFTEYEHYGGRGITVCDRWRESFENFYMDIGNSRPSLRHSLERMDNDGPYSLENCRWATYQEQRSNTRFNRFVEYQGERITLAEFSRRTCIPYKTLQYRVFKMGLSTTCAVTHKTHAKVKKWI